MVISHGHGAQIGVFGFLPTIHAKKKPKTNAYVIFEYRVVFYAKTNSNKCLHDIAYLASFCMFIFTLRPQYKQVTYTSDKQQLF